MKNNKQFTLKTLLLFLAAAVICTASLTGFLLQKNYENQLENEGLRKYAEVLDIINEHFVGEYSEEDLTDAALAGMMSALNDRWSYYLTAAEYTSYRESENNAYTGIGITASKDEETGYFIVQSVHAGSPAEKAGIAAGDTITAAQGTDLADFEFSEFRKIISEHQATGVSLTVQNAAGDSQTLTLTGEVIVINPVSYEMLADNIGYVRLKNFEGGSSKGFIAAVNDLIDQGAAGFVFDVRNNPGGKLSELTAMLDFLLPSGTIFISRDKDGSESKISSDSQCVDLPMAVLVNKNSYSAAEFFAAALREYDRANIAGEQTTGKGRSQITLALSDNSAIHISSKEYFTPKGVSLAAEGGLTPDYELALSEEKTLLFNSNKLDFNEDDQLQKAVAMLFQ